MERAPKATQGRPAQPKEEGTDKEAGREELQRSRTHTEGTAKELEEDDGSIKTGIHALTKELAKDSDKAETQPLTHTRAEASNKAPTEGRKQGKWLGRICSGAGGWLGRICSEAGEAVDPDKARHTAHEGKAEVNEDGPHLDTSDSL